MRKIAILILSFSLQSCINNDCELEIKRINDTYDRIFEEQELTSNEIYRLKLDRNAAIKRVDCN